MTDEMLPEEAVENQDALEMQAVAEDQVESEAEEGLTASETVSEVDENVTAAEAVAEAQADLPVSPVELPVPSDEELLSTSGPIVIQMDKLAETAPPEPELGPVAAEEASPEGPVSLESLEAPQQQGASPLDAVMAQVSGLFAGRPWLAGVIIGVLILAFLFLPPLSLAQRLTGNNGYTAVSADNYTLVHPDGLIVSVDPEAVNRLRIRLDSLPLADFIERDELPETQAAARAAIPDYLTPKSPHYSIAFRGEPGGDVRLEVDIPLAAEPWETLDLYTWNGESWEWLPNRLERSSEERIVADLDTLPSSVMVMQSEKVALTIVTEAEDLPPVGMQNLLSSVDLVAMKIGTLGNMTGDAALLPPGGAGDFILAPNVRNWAPGREPNRGLVFDMLTIAGDRATHLTELVGLVEQGNYAGLVLDYRGLTADDRDAYAAFVTDLSAALHEQGAWLAVVVEMPERLADGSWETGGYDWARIGAAADQVRMMMPLAPQAYAPGGMVEELVVWATSQINRYKLYPVLSTLSTDGERTLSVAEVLDSLGEVTVAQTLTGTVEPGGELTFALSGQGQLETDALTEAVMLKTAEGDFWLGTPQWLHSRLALVTRHRLGGVQLSDLLDEGNMEGMAAVLASQAQPTTAYRAPEVLWTITGPDGATAEETLSLQQAEYIWTVPTLTGTYRIAASVAGVERGQLEVEVAVAVAEAEEEDEDALAAAEEEEEETLAEGIRARYVADVTVPDNTRFDKGAQFTKTWRVRNVGTEDWPEDTVLAFVDGQQMTELAQVEVGAVESGADVDISVELTAPEADGAFTGRWTLRTGNASIPGGLLTVVIRAGEEVVAEDPAPAPPPVTTAPIGGSFELGGHIRDHSIPHADLMRYSGMNWVKVQVRYPNDARGDIAIAHAKGFKIQVSILGPAGMVTEGGFNERIAQWAAGIAAAGADAIEIWNEPNIPREWQEGHINPTSYTQLLCASYRAIKAANPNAAVISAAPAPTGYFGGCYGHGCDDVPFLQGMYNAGAANCMDYIGAHHNSGATPPSATIGHPADPGSTHHSWFFLPQTQIYYNTFGGTRKLFYTELGYVSPEGYGWIPGTFAWGANTTVAQQAQWLAEVVQLSSQTGMVRAVIVWNIDFNCYGDCGGVQDPQGGYAIIRPDGSCPACDSLHRILGTR